MARDTELSAPPRTLVTTSITAELIFAVNLVASAPGSRSGVEADWVSRQRAQLDTQAASFLPRLEGFWWPTQSLVDFLCLNELYHDPERFLKELDSVPLDRFISVLFNGDLSPDQVTALFADPAAVGSLTDSLSRFSQGTPEALEAVFRDPEGHRQGLFGLIRASNTPLFREGFALLNRASEPTIQALERRLAVEDPLSVAESIREKPLHGPRSFDSFTFIPSRLIGHRHIQSWGGGRAVVFLQEGAIALNRPTETSAELAEFLKVLGDKTRMDILRLLCCGPSYGKEIAESLGLTTATVSRHLDQLKAAGLVKEERADGNNIKRLRYVFTALETQVDRLKTYLNHS